jgi:hypothetical protein
MRGKHLAEGRKTVPRRPADDEASSATDDAFLDDD